MSEIEYFGGSPYNKEEKIENNVDQGLTDLENELSLERKKHSEYIRVIDITEAMVKTYASNEEMELLLKKEIKSYKKMNEVLNKFIKEENDIISTSVKRTFGLRK